ncbi:MAG: CHASE2 domain-containing protein [Scytonematopsis contorta HA4267-MV1]|jgi:CHASE2 domain-containing sensor protein|nr:CHASE2 domain-containing protein [Scytonematopsis contorta HA4267-MV1]
MRPQEKLDKRVVIVGIDEQDIQSVGQYPVPDGKIAELITKLETYEPLAIGLDLFKNVPVQPGGEELTRVFQENTNIIGIEKILSPGETPPPRSLPPEQVGFVDLANDIDSKNRRYLLHTSNPKNHTENKDSLALKLVFEYCEKNGINVGTGKNDIDTIMFNQIELPRITKDFGGYVGVDDGGLSILINFRNSSQPFHVVLLRDVLNDKADINLLRGRIVLIGNQNTSAADIFYTNALPTPKLEGQIYGVEYHAHVISQILSTVIDRRPMLHSWGDAGEYTWIVIWGFLPIIIGRLTQSAWKNVFSVGIAGVLLLSCGYIMLWQWGVWIPVAPSFLVLAVNGVGLSAFAFYQHDKFLCSQIKERQDTVQYAFSVIHNGPLQDLSYVLKNMRTTKDMSYEQLLGLIEKIDKEIREIGEFLKLQARAKEENLRLGSGLILELSRPLHNLLYEVYSSTLERDGFEYFKTLKVKIPNFDPIDDKHISMEEKREICLFLEEALCNIGKHAQGVKSIQASGVYSKGRYKLCVQDDGCGIKSKLENKGTKHSKTIAKRLGGEFRRESVSPRGTICTLS